MRTLINPLLLLAFSLFIFSCKKNNTGSDPSNPTPGPGPSPKPCYIISYNHHADDPSYLYTLDYDYKNGSLKSVTNWKDGLERSFVKKDKVIIITTKKSGTQQQFDSVLLNDKGMIASIHSKYGNSKNFTRQVMQYGSGDQLEKIQILNNALMLIDSIVFKWEDGNMVREKHSTYTYEYTYYADQLLKDGDNTSFTQFMELGAAYIKNKNLVKSRKRTSSPYLTFIYDYGFNENKINHLVTRTWQAGDVDTSYSKGTYAYACP